MSSAILDTHALIWASSDSRQLGKSALRIIEKGESNLFVSVASLWEISILKSLDRIKFGMDMVDYTQLIQDELGVKILPIESRHFDVLVNLPFHHRDPFDRLLISQAKALSGEIISKDKVFDLYGCRRIW